MAQAGESYTAEWQVFGPQLASFEGSDGGYLGVEYTDNCDTRWEGQLILGPALTVLSCAARGGTTANINGFAVAPITMQAAGPFLYGSGGTKWAKISLTGGTSALTLASDGTEGAMAEATTCVLYTKNAAGTEEISFGMANTAYRVITAVGATTTDTDAANASSLIYSILSAAGNDAANREIACLGRGSGTPHNKVDQITLSGTVTMATPSATTRATIAGEAFTFTGFALDGDRWLLGTSNGTYYIDSDASAFAPTMEELDNDTAHCAQMARWSIFRNRVIVPLRRSLRYSKNVIEGASVGPESYRENTSPITGTCQAFASSERWGYMTFYNAVQDKTWLCAVRPRQGGDWHSYDLSYFPIAKLADGIESHAAIYTGTQGNTARTLPLVVIGYDTDIASFNEGRVDNFPTDTSYTYATSGTTYFTELRRQAQYNKDIDYFIVETANCSATETVTLSLTSTDENGNASTTQLGGPITSNGRHKIQVRGKTDVTHARYPKPQIALASGSSATSPKVLYLGCRYTLAEMKFAL